MREEGREGADVLMMGTSWVLPEVPDCAAYYSGSYSALHTLRRACCGLPFTTDLLDGLVHIRIDLYGFVPILHFTTLVSVSMSTDLFNGRVRTY